jgi:hypothetical protein
VVRKVERQALLVRDYGVSITGQSENGHRRHIRWRLQVTVNVGLAREGLSQSLRSNGEPVFGITSVYY